MNELRQSLLLHKFGGQGARPMVFTHVTIIDASGRPEQPDIAVVITVITRDLLGAIEKGKLAGLVLLEADPLKDIGNTRRISAVVLSGRLVTRSTPAAMLAKAGAAANQ